MNNTNGHFTDATIAPTTATKPPLPTTPSSPKGRWVSLETQEGEAVLGFNPEGSDVVHLEDGQAIKYGITYRPGIDHEPTSLEEAYHTERKSMEAWLLEEEASIGRDVFMSFGEAELQAILDDPEDNLHRPLSIYLSILDKDIKNQTNNSTDCSGGIDDNYEIAFAHEFDTWLEEHNSKCTLAPNEDKMIATSSLKDVVNSPIARATSPTKPPIKPSSPTPPRCKSMGEMLEEARSATAGGGTTTLVDAQFVNLGEGASCVNCTTCPADLLPHATLDQVDATPEEENAMNERGGSSASAIVTMRDGECSTTPLKEPQSKITTELGGGTCKGDTTYNDNDGINQDMSSIAEVTLEEEGPDPDEFNVIQVSHSLQRRHKPRCSIRLKGTIRIRLEQLRVDCNHQTIYIQSKPEEIQLHLGPIKRVIATKCNNSRFGACIAKQKLKDIICHLRKKGIGVTPLPDQDASSDEKKLISVESA